MNNFRYKLDSKKIPKLNCPYCGAKKHWVRYIDTETSDALPEYYGKCDNDNKCAHWNDPYKLGYAKKIWEQEHGTRSELPNNRKPEPRKVIQQHTPEPKPISFIDYEIFERSLNGYKDNNLIKYLKTIFDNDTVCLLINLYKIGTSSRYGGGTTVYWQIDSNDNIRAGKLIKYADNGHRMHGKNNWVHSVLKLVDFNLKQCLFGEHILKHAPDATVCIVESEKTAIIATAFMPDMVWLATGGAENLNKDKMKVLQGRNVILFPDASKDGRIYNKWKAKADELGFNISSLLEREATPEQKAWGVDIADFLMKMKQPESTQKRKKDYP